MAGQPEKIQNYEIIEEVGRGAMGAVYSAHDPLSNELVAIKIAHPQTFTDGDQAKAFRNLFFNEAHATRVLDHPNIIRTHDAGIEGRLCFLVMEYVYEARTLADFCTPDNLLPLDEALRILYLVAKALAYAHERGVVHRDLKPTNILFGEEGEIKVSDFSVALVNRPDSAVTQITGLVGSPLYMAPEQLLEQDVGPRSDIFSLGIIAYELLTGTHPFKAKSLYELSRNIIEHAPPPPGTLRPAVPAAVDAIVMRMLEKQPDARFPECGEVAAAVGEQYYAAGAAHEQTSLQEKIALLRRTEFFRDFTDEQMLDFARSCGLETVDAGRAVVNEGENQHGFFIIVAGIADVTKNEVHIGSLKDGDCFGEMGFLSRCERTATVTARTDLTLIRVSERVIETASESTRLHFYRSFVRILVARLQKATETISLLQTT